MVKTSKRQYLKCMGYDDLPKVIAQLLNVDPDSIQYLTLPLISSSDACASFTLKDDASKTNYFALLHNFECHLYSDKEYNVMHKKSYANIICKLIEYKHKMGVIKLTADEYKQDYNTYHMQPKEKNHIKYQTDGQELLY